jgi:hypothetical protein
VIGYAPCVVIREKMHIYCLQTRNREVLIGFFSTFRKVCEHIWDIEVFEDDDDTKYFFLSIDKLDVVHNDADWVLVVNSKTIGISRPNDIFNFNFKYERENIPIHVEFNWSYSGSFTSIAYIDKTESKSVTFDITPDNQVTLYFDEPVTIYAAVKKAEEFLNKLLTQKYLDTYNIPQKLSDYKKGAKRGDVLGEYKHIENIEFGNGTVVIHCGHNIQDMCS